MDGSPGEELLAYCQRRAGDSLRGVVLYDADRHRVLYARDDLTEEYAPAALAPVLEHLRAVHELPGADPDAGIGLRDEAEVHDAPATSTSVYLMEGVLVVHHLLDDGRGVAVVLDADAGRSLVRFVAGCLQQVREGFG